MYSRILGRRFLPSLAVLLSFVLGMAISQPTQAATLGIKTLRLVGLSDTKVLLHIESTYPYSGSRLPSTFRKIDYGTDPNNLDQQTTASALTNLTPNTKYYYRVTLFRTTESQGDDQTVSSAVLSVTTRVTPKITKISPTKGSKRGRVVITGVGFGGGPNPNNTNMRFGVFVGYTVNASHLGEAKILSWTNTQITIQLGSTSKTGPVYIKKHYFASNVHLMFNLKGPTYTVRY